MAESESGRKRYKELQARGKEHQIERVGEQLRDMMPWISEGKQRVQDASGGDTVSCHPGGRRGRRREGMQLPKAPELVVTGLAAALLVGSVVGFANTAGRWRSPVEPGEVAIEGFAFGPDAVTVDVGRHGHLDELRRHRPHRHRRTAATLLDSPDLGHRRHLRGDLRRARRLRVLLQVPPGHAGTITVEG